MTRRLFLHIGTHKTGSTAIQKALDGFDDGTTAYAKLSHRNHTYDMRIAFCDDPETEMVNAQLQLSRAQMRREVAKARQRVQSQVESSRRNLIVSGEGLSQNFSEHEIDRLKTCFAPAFDEIRLIAYLREPLAYRLSAMQEIMKTTACPLAEAPFADYRKRLEPWEKVFGRDAIDYVFFGPGVLVGQDVVADFAARIGLVWRPLKPIRANEGMSAEAFAALYRLRSGPPVSRLAWPERRIRAVARNHREFGRRQFAIAEAAWQDWTAAEVADIAWAEDRIGRPFVPELPKPDALVFGSEADILAYAHANASDFREWSKRRVPVWRLAWKTFWHGILPRKQTLRRLYAKLSVR